MTISLDNLAYRYGMLPSEALRRGTTFDFRVMEISAKWENRRRRLDEEPEVVAAEDRTKELGPDYLQQMMDAVKGDNNANSEKHNRQKFKQDNK